MDGQLALSTTWLNKQTSSLKTFFTAARQAGFNKFELDGKISLSDISDFSLPEGDIQSIQMPCPAHPDTFDATFGSLNRYERDAARRAAKNTFELANDLKTEIVIVYLGRVDINPLLEQSLKQAWLAQGQHAAGFAGMGLELIKMRARMISSHIKPIMQDLEYLLEQADRYRLKLALSTPRSYNHFPLPDELAMIFDEFGTAISYWHNPAQAHIFEQLNLLPAADWLSFYTNNGCGLYINDTVDLKTKSPPQENSPLNFNLLAKKRPDNLALTLNVSPAVTVNELQKAVAFVNNTFQTQNKIAITA